MSTQSVETILSRAMSDVTFADSLFVTPEQALSGYDLTAEEISVLKEMSRTDFEAFSKASPEERKSFSLGSHGAGGHLPATGNHNETALFIR